MTAINTTWMEVGAVFLCVEEWISISILYQEDSQHNEIDHNHDRTEYVRQDGGYLCSHGCENASGRHLPDQCQRGLSDESHSLMDSFLCIPLHQLRVWSVTRNNPQLKNGEGRRRVRGRVHCLEIEGDEDELSHDDETERESTSIQFATNID